jgi:CheY-like chemotaxis protein
MVRLTALLVDDDPVSHFVSASVLRHIGVQKIRTVLNGKEALDHVIDKEGHLMPDVIFVDLNMPIMDGFEFIKEFRRLSHFNHSKTKLVILTSSFDPNEKRQAAELGVTNFLTKPASEQDFLEILEPLIA